MEKVKKIVWTMIMAMSAMLCNSTVAFAAEKGAEANIGETLPLVFCLPFAGMLLCIAICPLVIGPLWEKKKHYAVIFWSLAFIIPFAVYAGVATTKTTA